MKEMGRGRYLISVEAVETRDPGQVVIHDMDGGVDERCNSDAIKTGSRFDDLAWAERLGYRRCKWCFVSRVELATVADALADAVVAMSGASDFAEGGPAHELWVGVREGALRLYFELRPAPEVTGAIR